VRVAVLNFILTGAGVRKQLEQKNIKTGHISNNFTDNWQTAQLHVLLAVLFCRFCTTQIHQTKVNSFLFVCHQMGLVLLVRSLLIPS